MMPNLGGLNPRKVQSMMKQMGISNEEIDAKQVIIKTEGKDIVIDNPSVTKIKMQGQESFQISGDVSEKEGELTIPKEDIEMVSQNANISHQEAEKLLKENEGDIAKAISSTEE